ncbi:MAG: type I secretion system permease/ATPase [Rhodospirillales bacterium]|nr:type I secretion system permease/ATPase [Rhodospirillales bacterium]
MAGEPINPLRAAVRECRIGTIYLALFSACINVLILTSPIYMMQVYDRVLASGKIETLIFLTLIAGIAVLVLGLLEMVRNRLMARIGQWFERRMSPDLIAASMRAAMLGAAANAQALRDLIQVRAFLGGPGSTTIFDAPWTPIFLAVIWLMHPVLGMVGLGSAVVLFGLAILNEYVSRKPLKQAAMLSIVNTQSADQAIRNADAFHAMGMLPGFLVGWMARNERALGFQLDAADWNATLVGLSKFSRIFVQILILAVGAFLVIRGEMTSGGMIAGSILLGRALAPVEQAISAWKGMIAARDAYDRLNRLFEKVPPPPQVMTLPPPTGVLSCEQLVFVPRGRDKPVLNGVTFSVDAGDALGIIGPSAAGKSTLCKILVGSWQPTRGQARLDGADVFTWPSENLGPYIGYLPQDVELFGGTVKDNIARLIPDADSEAVVEAARTAGVHEIILRLPKGYETEIGESGSHLSGGQRQRIGLARALYGKPRLIVLDEPNASLDTEGEESLMNAMSLAKKWGATVIIVAHQPRILRGVDKLLLLRDGRSEMFGPRDEVLAKLMPQRVGSDNRPRAVKAVSPAPGSPAQVSTPIVTGASGAPTTASPAQAAQGGAAK